jgi:CubicO group peptidase (beta-lactamase class C family)
MNVDPIRRWMHGYVENGTLPGALTLIAREGEPLFFEGCGTRDLEAGEPIEVDTIFRIYSMTKPVTAAAAMLLVEEGALALDDPVARFVPSFVDLTVNRFGTDDRIEPEPLQTPMTVLHLLTHTSGLTYGEGNPGAVSRIYQDRRTDFGDRDGVLAEVVDRLAGIPLLFQPGTAWNYGVSLDVLGRVIEVASGTRLDRFFRERIFEPLEMVDTGFGIREEQRPRLAALYEATPEDGLALLESPTAAPTEAEVTTFAGGAGLLSTTSDYLRFAEMLRREGELDGVRVLEASTVRTMVANHLPGDLAEMRQETFNETETAGVGFGLGVSVVVDPSRTAWRSFPGEFGWGGYASTTFWVDPEHDVTVIFMTQVIPSDRYPIRGELHALVADAFDGQER